LSDRATRSARIASTGDARFDYASPAKGARKMMKIRPVFNTSRVSGMAPVRGAYQSP
jgi:hypothetical protein